MASEVVKRIFLLANEGKSPRAIAELLTEEKVLIPAAHAREYHPEQYNGIKFTDPYLWGMSTIRGILSRQEYLGHTVLRKSVSTNFKLHKRKNTDEDEQYVFYNTHEPIITQELWDSVQKRKKRANRTATKGTHSNRLSGYLYCADCGRRMTLQTHYSKKDRSVQYSYRCGGYASKVNSCSAHSISADNVETLILSAVKRLSRFVLNDEEAFAKELQALWNEKQTEKPKQNKSELLRFQKRYDELSKLIRGLYENLVSGLLPERQYKQLMKQYDDEQAELETKIEEMQKELTEEKANTVDAVKFQSFSEPQPQVKVYRVKGSLKNAKKIGGLRGLYLHYCYKLGILPKGRKQNYARLHYLLKDDLMKMEAITQETRLLCRNHIDTAEQLCSYKGSLKTEMAALLQKRKEIYSKSRRTSGEEKEAVKAELSDISGRLKIIRKEVRLCEDISARSDTLKEKLQTIRADEHEQQRKELMKNEHRRRSGRTNRPNELGGL